MRTKLLNMIIVAAGVVAAIAIVTEHLVPALGAMAIAATTYWIKERR